MSPHVYGSQETPRDLDCTGGKDKPVAAQEPIAWMHGTAGRFEVIHAEVKKLWERVGQPAQFAKEVVSCKVENYTIPLYSHAVPCARCELNESIGAGNTMLIESLQAKITEQAAEIERLRESNKTLNRRAQKAESFANTKIEQAEEVGGYFLGSANQYFVQQQAERIKALEADLATAKGLLEDGRFLQLYEETKALEAKLAKADAVIFSVQEIMQSSPETDFVVPEIIAEIEAYQKGE